MLKIPDTHFEDSPITKREVSLKNFDDLVTTDVKLKDNIIDKYISGSEKPVELSVDYSQYENYEIFLQPKKVRKFQIQNRTNRGKYSLECFFCWSGKW